MSRDFSEVAWDVCTGSRSGMGLVHRRLKESGKKYGLGWTVGIDGVVRVGVDEEELMSSWIRDVHEDRDDDDIDIDDAETDVASANADSESNYSQDAQPAGGSREGGRVLGYLDQRHRDIKQTMRATEDSSDDEDEDEDGGAEMARRIMLEEGGGRLWGIPEIEETGIGMAVSSGDDYTPGTEELTPKDESTPSGSRAALVAAAGRRKS